MATEKAKIINFLNEQIAQADFRAKAYVFDEENKKRPQRNIFIKIKGYLNDFLEGKTAVRWITLTGLRGAGKTTILSQLLYDSKEHDVHKLFLSLDQTRDILGVTLDEVLSVFEEIIGRSLESLDKPLLLFLDEAQYDEKWGIVLKSVYDRTNKVFICVTGSAALLMNKNTDIARRTVYEKLFPLSFPEYLKINQKKFEEKGMGNEARTALFGATNAKQAYRAMLKIDKKANTYYAGITRHDFNAYLHYGSLPFMVSIHNEAIIYDQINKSLDRVVNGDIATTGNFSSDIISKIPGILYAVADMDAFNFSTIGNAFEISRPTVAGIFELLVHTEILHRIYPYGSHLNQAGTSRKPSKYLFSSPAFRAMYYKMIGNTISAQNARGKLMEDLVGMYLYRIFYKKPGHSLTYDSAQGGADFILGVGKKRIIIEVGAGKKDYKQIVSTSKKVNPDYSLIVSEDELELSEDLNAVKIPLRLFLLT